MMKIIDKTIVVPKKEQHDLIEGKEGTAKLGNESEKNDQLFGIVICCESLKIP